MKRIYWILLIVLLLLALPAIQVYQDYFRSEPPPHFDDPVEHFKYGSIGAEVNGIPYDIWRTLPDLFPDRLPEGYAQFGFITEADHALPVGVSVRKYDVERVGFNCATCHASTFPPDDALVLGAPAIALDLEGYRDFLLEAVQDERLTTDRIFESLKRQGVRKNFVDRLVYSWFLLPRVRKIAQRRTETHAWEQALPRHGPGRTDAANPWKYKFGILEPIDSLVPAAVSFPSVWNQRDRRGSWLHWDGNNNSLQERNYSAALAGGATEQSLDTKSIQRVAVFLDDLPPPAYPFPIDSSLAAEGSRVYATAQCGTCHDKEGSAFGGSTAVGQVGTDPYRWQAFNRELLDHFATVGSGYDWQFNHYRKSVGYANQLLDGIWARAPYLHNNSVPNLQALLTSPAERATSFLIGCTNYDTLNVGLACREGFPFDTLEKGNGKEGHAYGTDLSDADKLALLEYLKTL